MKQRERFKKYVAAKRLWKLDIAAVVLFLVAFLGVREWKTWYSLRPQAEVELVNPYLAQADSRGNTYVIDQERSRIVKIDADGQVECLLVSNMKEADSFWYAEDVAVGDDGMLYVLDASWDESGFAIDRECILVYDQNGTYKDTLLDITYEDELVDKHRLFALTFCDDTLYYVESVQEGFSLFSVSTETGEVNREQFYPYDNAFNLIQDYALDFQAKEVYALDKRGKILKGTDGVLTELYSTAEDPAYAGKTAFYRLAVDGEGVIYVTDIRENYLFSFVEGQESPQIFMDEGQVLSVTSAMQEDGSTVLGLWLDWGISMRNTETGTVMEGSSFAKTSGYRLTETCYEICAALLVLSVVWLLLRFLVMLFGIKMTQIQRNGLLAGATAAVVSVLIVSQLLDQFESLYREELLSKLYVMAYTVSGVMDSESLQSIRTCEDYMEEDYRDLMDLLEIAFNREDPSTQEVYCNVLALEDGQGFAIAYLDNSIGTYYPLDEAETMELEYIYQTGDLVRNDGKDDVTGSYIYVRVPVTTEAGDVTGVIEVGTLSEVVTGKIDEMRASVMITLILVILIVMFLFGEILSFFDIRERQRRKEQKNGMPLHLLRLSIFVTYLAFNIASSFLPVYAAGFVTDSLGIPRELAASLPITLNLIFIGVTSMFCAGLLHRFSFRTVAAASACVSMVGDSLLFLGHSYGFLVLGLILNGIGVGLITNSINMFIAGSSQDDVRKEGFSLFNAGSLSGINCGMMFGASLAGVVGQRTVFACSAGAWLVVALLFVVMGRHMNDISFANAGGERRQKKTTASFLGSRNVVPYLLLIQFPYVVINSFVFYYVPIYGDAMGFSESIVCLFLMLNSLCSVYLSVSITKFVSERFGEKSVYLSTVVSCGALVLFGWNSSVPMLIAVLIVLGIVASFATAVRQVYFTELPAVARYGEDSAMGVYNLMDNVGQSAGPILFGSILSGTNNLPGLSCFAAVSLVMNGAYALLSRGKEKQAEAS